MTATLLVLLFSRLPVFVAILGASVAYFVLAPDISPAVSTQQVITGAESATLPTIPFSVCAGVLMNYTGTTRRTMDSCTVLTDRTCGGSSQVDILLSTLMDGLSGSAPTDVIVEARTLVSEMEKKETGRVFSMVVMAASSVTTPLISPGVGLILYGYIVNVSIGRLLVAGFGPGALLCAAMMSMASRISKKRGHLSLRMEKIHPSMFWRSFRSAVLPLCLPIIITGGIRLGVLTVTEAGLVATVYVAILSTAYRELGSKEIAQGLKEMLQITPSIVLIMAAAPISSRILTKETTPQRFTERTIQVINNKWIFLVAVNIFLVSVGMFIEGNASIIMLAPLLAPVAVVYGIDPIHFAMMFVFANITGASTSPMGTLVFVTCGVTKRPTRDFIKEVVLFYALLFGYLPILIFVPLFPISPVNSVC